MALRNKLYIKSNKSAEKDSFFQFSILKLTLEFIYIYLNKINIKVTNLLNHIIYIDFLK